MPFIIFLVAVILVLTGIGMNAPSIRRWLDRRPRFARGFLMAYIAFAGCFTFPIASEPFPLDFTKAYLLLASYGVIGLAFAGLCGPGRTRLVYPSVLLFTALGMACRYLLEYGEVSNTYNFTAVNIIAYLTIIPVYTVIAYLGIVAFLKSRA